ncbi:hypothetical protein NC796_02560 [Aliifodinibius sp. S!AR15-10]|uniref:hypothetical protein n=1 Tax=Aliifodinibius sp. S!AR15-10 TaxID=2950437 RepID=UPI002864E19E|nr:hypothetical protein [Aliifodinibius sp. S!AR15-10]MDR8390004.1 hypothetical protein [Aliifodinibius sp. S!AR15-10]
MSEITGKQFREAFKMRVVSGMLVGGSIQISWATGEKSSSQLDWGYDPSVPFTTPEYHREPPDMVRYHTLPFPKTLTDTEHFFRVRSRTASGRTGESPVYSVIVPEKLRTLLAGKMLAPFAWLNVTPAGEKQEGTSNYRAQLLSVSTEPEWVGSPALALQLGPAAAPDQTRPIESKNISTANTITIT